MSVSHIHNIARGSKASHTPNDMGKCLGLLTMLPKHLLQASSLQNSGLEPSCLHSMLQPYTWARIRRQQQIKDMADGAADAPPRQKQSWLSLAGC